MKRILSTLLLVTFVFLTCLPGFAQRGRFERERRQMPVERVHSEIPERKQGGQTEFGNIEALTDGTGVLIRWEMRSEVDNVGFQVLRADGSKQPVHRSLIAGAAAGARREAAGGESYQTFDPNGGLGSTYTIESIDIQGRRVSSQAVSSGFVENLKGVAGISSSTLMEAAIADNGTITTAQPVLSGNLYRRTRRLQPENDLATHRMVVSQPGVKIAVSEEGFYKISCAQLAGAGFNTSGKATNWRLFREGVEQAITVGSGDRCIEFYGKGIDTAESGTRVYYLIAGTSPGKRIGSRALKSNGGQLLSSNYPYSYQKKERTFYVPQVNNGDAENYWGSIIFGVASNIEFNLTGVDASATNAQMTVKLQGFPNGGDPNFEHRVRIRINGADLGNIIGLGETGYSGTFQVPVSNLREGVNNLELTSVNASDLNLFDAVSVNYARKYQAYQNKVAFTTPGSRRVDLTGFASSNIRVFDMAAEGEPLLIPNLPVVAEGGGFTVRLPSGPALTAFGLADSALLQPQSVSRNNASTLSTAANDGELVILSHSAADFMAAAESWANYRRSQGISVRVIDIADVFDEFSYGSYSSAAITAFLNYSANNWQTKPRYVLLIGDGTSDPRSYQGYPNFNYIPTKMVNLIYGESGSDEAVADFNGDGLAELAVGRIPMRTADTVLSTLNKTMQFETAAQQSLNRGALFAFDIPSGWNFQLTSERLRDELPPTMPHVMIGRGFLAPANDPYSLDPNAQTTLINTINTGKFIVNYAGHGTSGKWFDDSFFGSPHAAQLTNGQNLSIFTMLTCLNGYFLRPDNADSISDVLLKNLNGGAVATWASTADTTPDIQAIMAVRFYDQLAVGNIDRIGDLIRDAKTAIPGGGDVRLSWSLLGDPMLRVGQ